MSENIIDKLAKLICINLGLNPDEMVKICPMSEMTPSELAASVRANMQIPIKFSSVERPIWRMYRKEAAIALATKQSLGDLK